nr:uncharacterized protein LOC105845244 isoform X2 [Hydra vulgaris]
MCVFSFKQLQVSKYMQSKVRKENNTFQLIVGDMAHVLKSSVTVDSARMKTLIPFCIMEYTSWQFLAHCHPNTGRYKKSLSVRNRRWRRSDYYVWQKIIL